jgi:hypothetical protein
MTTLEPMAAHNGLDYQPVIAIYTDDNTIAMRRLPGRYATKADAQRQAREHIADAIAYAHVTYLGLPLSILSEPDASSEAQIGFSFDDWLGS